MGRATPFQRILLPGLAFKAVVIGGGYATGRELSEFFMASGPAGGLLGMALSGVLWSLICALTFLFAYVTRSLDYRTFFEQLLGRFWVLFELAYVAVLLVMLSVFSAAAGTIAASTFGVPALAGSLALIAAITLSTSAGNASVEPVFKYVSIFLYAVYIVFVVVTVSKVGGRIESSIQSHPIPPDWAIGGLTYAGYNVVGAVVVLPVVRHMASRTDAVVAGLLCGPLAILPAFLFFLCMAAYYREIAQVALPSDFVLSRLDLPVFAVVFQVMILAALVESGAGAINAINERLSNAPWRRGRAGLSPRLRVASSVGILTIASFVATEFGLIALIASGYRALAYLIILIFVVPLFTLGIRTLIAARRVRASADAGAAR